MTGRQIADVGPYPAGRRPVQDTPDDLPVVVYRCRDDALWTCTSVNGTIAELGYTPRRWREDPGLWLRRIHPDDRERVVRERQAAHADGDLDIEYRIRTADGTERFVNDRARYVATGDGGAFHGVLIDMTAHRLADRTVAASLEHASEEAEQSERALALERAMLRLLLHDARSPVAMSASVLDDLARAMDGELTDAASREDLVAVARALERATEVLEELDDRIEDDGWRPSRRERVPFGGLVRDAIREVGVDPDRVDVLGEDVGVLAVVAAVRRALVGLVRNAVVHTDPSTRLVLAAVPRDDGVVLQVEDDGPGFPEHARAHAFDPVVHLDDDQGTGRGIGLSLVREVAELHGGEVWLEDVEAGGTCVSMFLPDDDPGIH